MEFLGVPDRHELSIGPSSEERLFLFLRSFAVRKKGKVLLLFFASIFCLLFLANVMRWHTDSIVMNKKVAVLLPGAVSFFDVERASMLKAAQDLSLDLIFFNAGWDPYGQIHQLEKVLSMNSFDAVALCAVDSQALMRASTLMQGQEIPLVSFTNGIGFLPDGRLEGVKAYVGRDEIKAGKMLGRAIERLSLDEPPRILLIQGAPGTAPQRFREMGFNLIVDQHPEWTIVESALIPEWSLAEVEHTVQQVLDTRKEMNVIATQWAGAAVAAGNILKANKARNIKLVSLEYTHALQQLLHEGVVQITSNFSVQEEGRRTVETIAQLLEHGEANAFIEILQTEISSFEAQRILPEW